MSQAMVFAATDSLSRLIYILQVFLQEISVNKISFSVVFFVLTFSASCSLRLSSGWKKCSLPLSLVSLSLKFFMLSHPHLHQLNFCGYRREQDIKLSHMSTEAFRTTLTMVRTKKTTVQM